MTKRDDEKLQDALYAVMDDRSSRDKWEKLATLLLHKGDRRGEVISLAYMMKDITAMLVGLEKSLSREVPKGVDTAETLHGFVTSATVHVSSTTWLRKVLEHRSMALVESLSVHYSPNKKQRANPDHLMDAVKALNASRPTVLTLVDWGIGNKEIIQLAAQACLSRVEHLNIGPGKVSKPGVEALVRSQHLRKLEQLDMRGNPISNADARSVLEAKGLLSLARLVASGRGCSTFVLHKSNYTEAMLGGLPSAAETEEYNVI